MKNPRFAISLLLSCLCLLFCFSSCIDEEEFAETPQGNFEALWKIMDEHYCFFDYKRVDWNEVHHRYAAQIDNNMTQTQLFEVLANMLAELRDGHVNLYTAFDLARNWSWHEDHPKNFSDSLLAIYLGKDYKISNGMSYRMLDDNVGYVRCPTFEYDFGSGNLDNILSALITCRGLIVDVRNNGGGMMTSAKELAARFTNEKIHVGYMRHKTGPGHDDFSPMTEQTLTPSNGVRWQKPVVVLTNRSVYSAANEFVKYMKCCPNVVVVGDKTGGGAGLPFSSEMPNGWGVRFSACPMYDRDKQDTEFGIEPTHQVQQSAADFARGHDTIIEYARRLLAK
uniref:S41 family peptidase n=1 Tax=Prevotella sp. GTC17262 TaxID=3236797 RepID=A0AB33JN72_9BACT